MQDLSVTLNFTYNNMSCLGKPQKLFNCSLQLLMSRFLAAEDFRFPHFTSSLRPLYLTVTDCIKGHPPPLPPGFSITHHSTNTFYLKPLLVVLIVWFFLSCFNIHCSNSMSPCWVNLRPVTIDTWSFVLHCLISCSYNGQHYIWPVEVIVWELLQHYSNMEPTSIRKTRWDCCVSKVNMVWHRMVCLV